jgi:transposase
MPPEIGAWGEQQLSSESIYRLIGDVLYVQYHDEDFADLYHREGQPALSPVLLALVSTFQQLENLSDRATANAVRTRLDWKYALHLPLNDHGFDSSVLCEFRKRLLTHDAEARLFEQVLTQLKGLGLIKTRGVQRTDSLALLTRARTLGRLELVFETLRVALKSLLQADKDWLEGVLPAEWPERYRKHCRDERKSDEERAALERVSGDDGQWLLDQLAAEDAPAPLRELAAVEVLRTVWSQQFETVEGHLQFRAPNGSYNGEARIQTPYDPEARYSQKRKSGWTGYKLQLTETDDENLPHLITDIAVTPSVMDDRTALESIAERQEAREVAPSTRYVDQGYVGGPTLVAADERGEDLVGPAPKASSPQSRMEGGFTHADFQIDVEREQAVCPAGHRGTPKMFQGHQDNGDYGIVFTFQKQHCGPCPLRARCITGKKQERRYLVVRQTYTRLQQARERVKTDEFKAAYGKHRAPVEGCLSALVRGQGIRRCRYVGQEKNHLRALFVGVAVNLRRSAAWRAGLRHRPPRPGLGLVSAKQQTTANNEQKVGK